MGTIKTAFGECVDCQDSTTKPLANKRLSLCQYHNNIRKQKAKAENGKVPAKRTRKATGEAVVFAEIWATRPHICHNCKCGLPKPVRAWYFMHVKSKGAHPGLRLTHGNIELACWDCHYAYDFQGQAKYNARNIANLDESGE